MSAFGEIFNKHNRNDLSESKGQAQMRKHPSAAVKLKWKLTLQHLFPSFWFWFLQCVPLYGSCSVLPLNSSGDGIICSYLPYRLAATADYLS